MTLRERLTTRLVLSRLLSVSVFLCAFTFLPHSQFAVHSGPETVEGECPCQEDGENSKEELVVSSSARRRLNVRRHDYLIRPHRAGNRLHSIVSEAGPRAAIVGHLLTNGFCAPLLI